MQLAGAVLVEGRSDAAAVEALARRRGVDLVAAEIGVLPMGGATGIGRFLAQLGPRGMDIRLAGLCDVAEEGLFRHHLERAGLGAPNLDRASMQRIGFFVCEADLEDELIRALGVERVQEVIGEHGDLGSWRTMQRQPAQRDRPIEAQLRRFMGTTSGRKVRYAALLVDALDLDGVPPALDGVLAHLVQA